MISLSSTPNQFLLDWANTMKTNDMNKILSLYDKNAVLLGTIANSFEVKRLNIKDYFIEFLGKNVLLVDDSIVRGTTATQIVAVSWSIGRKKNIKRKNQSGSGEENEIK